MAKLTKLPAGTPLTFSPSQLISNVSLGLTLIGLFICSNNSAGADPGELDFNRDIRPILAENCFYCHGQDGNKRQGDLRLDLRDAAVAAGAIVPGDAAASTLVQRIHADDPEQLMPPSNSNRRLSAEQKTLLAKWITDGAKYRTHWAFTAPVRPAEPEVKLSGWVRTPIDRFVLAKLEAEGLPPSTEADRATLIKRLSVDLTGLPPRPEEVESFMKDNSEGAYEALVDRLLNSPHYGERMALSWLDAARYADSNGFQQDGDTWQWIWRDWVVKALNNDLPFDQFTIWQLAGDLLPDASNDQKIASGFNRNHLLNGEGGAIPEEQRFVNLFDRMDTTSTNWLGLTMACVQCHDHKYDPITQRDYYSLLDAFNRVPESGTPQYFSSRIRVAAPFIELPTDENKARFAELETQIAASGVDAKLAADSAFEGWKTGLFADGKPAEGNGLPEPVAAILRKPDGERTDEEKKSLEPSLRKYFDEKVRSTLVSKIPALAKLDGLNRQLADYRADQLPRVMVMSDAAPRETKILDRGEYLSPTEKVLFATPAFLPPLPADAPRNRLGFAQWLFIPEHPLTARVQVNRMWQHFFGTGIVKTSEDFGVQSEFPIHGELLDWLADEFRQRGWSMKSMHKLIVMSATYRQSSKLTPELKARDIENRLYARASRMRMPSLILRDWALASSGLLDPRIGGRPVYPYQPDAVWEALAITKERDFTYPASQGADLYRRSIYTFWRRTVNPSNMFDTSNRQTCRVRSIPTSSPLHALTTLNDPTWVEAARMLAENCLHHAPDRSQQLSYAFERVLCRTPTASDLARLHRAYDRQFAIYQNEVDHAKTLLKVGAAPRDESLNVSEHAALTAVCLGILNFDEALTRE
ncbi:PSD1 and planctomycete cytochrome C domain-containing protein [Schlesneria sp. T3-172]|uniref:PSD1 and planctomycete cytochrome C domain-containing protein n=1 Tax=Schlesneria sphaerica TaxID=3373610 RepID=UPI0037CA630A